VRRGTARREVQIDVPAERAWAVVSRADLLHLWFPGIVACEVKGDERTIHLATGIPLVETILTNDPAQRRFQYTIAGGFFTEHLGSIDVLDLGEERCLVTYSSDVRPAVMSLILGGATHGALRELRRQLEAGEGPALDALARPTVIDTTAEA
jgi:carbon monoxide dehydrogenase subunit G